MQALNHTLLIGNGEPVSSRLLRAWARTADFILAADGGAEQARAAGLTPDLIIGDLDSVSLTTRRAFAATAWEHLPDPHRTDLQKALDFLVKHHCRRVTLAGFTGGRIDFSFGNLLAIYPYAKKLDVCLAGNGWRIYPVFRHRLFTAQPGARVSLLPLKNCRGVTLRGLKFPLQNAYLPLGTTRSLSNQATAKRFTVSLTSGFLLVYQEENARRSPLRK